MPDAQLKGKKSGRGHSCWHMWVTPGGERKAENTDKRKKKNN